MRYVLGMLIAAGGVGLVMLGVSVAEGFRTVLRIRSYRQAVQEAEVALLRLLLLLRHEAEEAEQRIQSHRVCERDDCPRNN